jgi:hypothetical protein
MSIQLVNVLADQLDSKRPAGMRQGQWIKRMNEEDVERFFAFL